jgi:hypothetical protein
LSLFEVLLRTANFGYRTNFVWCLNVGFHTIKAPSKKPLDMKFLPIKRAKYVAIISGLIAALATWHTLALTKQAPHAQKPLGPDDTEFIFVGKCHTGESYRMHHYSTTINGESLAFFDYQGPAGTGRVGTPATPQVLSARICRPSAEIVSVY